MSKEKFLIIILLFLLFVVIGFCVTSNAAQVLWALPTDNSQTPPHQVNYLAIHVSSLEEERPQVIAIWGIFIYLGDPVSIKAQVLYPSPNPQGDLAASAFTLSSDKLPSPEFINLVKTTFDIPVDNTIVVDDLGISTLYAWVNDINPESLLNKATPPDLSLFETSCQRIRAGKVKTGISVDWEQLSPNHLRTSFGLDEFMVQWKTIVAAGENLDCEALSSQP